MFFYALGLIREICEYGRNEREKEDPEGLVCSFLYLDE
jgi:hypothetical protein